VGKETKKPSLSRWQARVMLAASQGTIRAMAERQQNTWNPDNDAANRCKGATRWQLRAAFEMLRESDRFCKAAEKQEMVVTVV
jgi:hypothetical protein